MSNASHDSDASARGKRATVVGGGPAGLMAADVLSAHGIAVDVFDAMPSMGRKFLRAGVGGLNITHSEPYPAFCTRFGERPPALQQALDAFPPDAVRAWVHTLGVDTFVGTSGRVFPSEMKAAPLLRAWLHRLREHGVRLHTRHCWHPWTTAEWQRLQQRPQPPAARSAQSAQSAPDARQMPIGFDRHTFACSGTVPLRFATPDGERTLTADAVILALGGASWPQLGSRGDWNDAVAALGVEIAPWQSANGGFAVNWSDHLRERHAGAPLKSVALTVLDAQGCPHRRQGELVIGERGVEGSLIYAFSRLLREGIAAHGSTTCWLDLAPGRDAAAVAAAVAHPRGSRSITSHLQSRLGLTGVKAALLYEVLGKDGVADPVQLGAAIKALPLTLTATFPLAEAISSAGGVCFDSLDRHGMAHALPGVFFAGEMLDWEAPTGGYLLSACLATGRAAGYGALRYLQDGSGPDPSTMPQPPK